MLAASLVADVNTARDVSRVGTFDGFVGPISEVAGKLVFPASGNVTGVELWSTDGTAAGTTLLKDITPGPGSSVPENFTPAGGALLFTTSTGALQRDLWRTDGTEAGTTKVAALQSQTLVSNSWPPKMVSAGSVAYFSAGDSVHGDELWRSDGTAAGTVMVKDITPGVASSPVNWLTPLGTDVYFTAAGELWKSDGTEAGTAAVRSSSPADPDGPRFADQLTVVGEKVVFSAQDASGGREPWVTDGTAAGTVRLQDIQPGAGGSGPQFFGAGGGVAYFVAGQALWKTDGTPAGTVRVRILAPASIPAITPPSGLVTPDGRLYFSVHELETGTEPWISDGTEAGTVRLKDLAPDFESPSSDPREFSLFGDKVVFNAFDRTAGRELYVTDGTEAGTIRLADIFPGQSSSSPGGFRVFGGDLYFGARDLEHGRELWKYTPDPAAAQVVGRHVFYNGSALDGSGLASDAGDDAAIATDKVALLPGDATSAANVTSYARGLNGVMIDVAGLPAGDELDATDFAFDVGGSAAPPPASITVRRGAGTDGSDRVTITWPDGAIRNTWLRVTLQATAHTGLATADVFSFGNLIGDATATAASTRWTWPR